LPEFLTPFTPFWQSRLHQKHFFPALIQQNISSSAETKKWGNLQAALALHFAYYNFCCQHSSLRVTPAMEARITDHIWDISELIAA